MRRFLGTTDGTPNGDHAVAVARALAERAGGDFTSFTVIPGEAATVTLVGATPGRATRRRPAAGTGGLPGVEIVRKAETWGADLVVLGRRESSPEWPRTLGSTADMVLRKHAGPALFVPLGFDLPRHGIIALDGSLRGLTVATTAVALLNLAGARCGAICVLPGTATEDQGASSWQDPRSARASGLVDSMKLDAGPCELTILWGGPVAEILNAMRDSGSDLLILGIRRGGQPGDSGSGYAGRELLRSAPGAVLTIPI